MAGLNFRRRKKRINMKVLQEALMWAGEVVLAFGFACVLVYFFGAALSNVGQSMEPAIYSGDRVLINRLIYRVKAPTYGDLIVFKPNGNENAHYHIKRVVGLPGDTVTIESGRVFIDGELLSEEILTESMNDPGVAEAPVKLGEDEYFVLGDNRNNSEDSRSADIGNVRREDIMGMAWFNVTPGERFGWLP
ncbi:MAG: signal peptidase I [Lachnospiraceae bacterium]|nr:signal peptidase I [Lachnospiraceae bacterium]